MRRVELTGELVRPAVELRVGEPGVPVLHRHRVGCKLYLILEEPSDGTARVRRPLGAPQRLDHGLLLLRENAKLMAGAPWCARCVVNQSVELVCEARDEVGGEHIAVKSPIEHELFARPARSEPDVLADGARIDVHVLHRQRGGKLSSVGVHAHRGEVREQAMWRAAGVLGAVGRSQRALPRNVLIGIRPGDVRCEATHRHLEGLVVRDVVLEDPDARAGSEECLLIRQMPRGRHQREGQRDGVSVAAQQLPE